MQRKQFPVLVLILMLLLTMTLPAQASSVYCGSLESMKSYLWTCAERLDGQISFTYSSALDDILSDHEAVEDLLYNCAMGEWEWNRYDSTRTFTITVTRYYTGLKIARLWKAGRTRELNSRESEALRIAQGIKNRCVVDGEPLLTAKNIHDELCSRVTFTTRNPNAGSSLANEDTAIGALCYGQAECDGYSDAFYLIGTLCGLDVGYQRGHDASNDEAHIWNSISLDGYWFMMDVTWDDLDSTDFPKVCSYANFCFGPDFSGNHLYDARLSIHAYSNTSNRYYYYSNVRYDLAPYYAKLSDAVTYAINCRKGGQNTVQVMVDGVYDSEDLSNALQRKVNFRASWWIWTKQIGSRTVFTLIWC